MVVCIHRQTDRQTDRQARSHTAHTHIDEVSHDLDLHLVVFQFILAFHNWRRDIEGRLHSTTHPGRRKKTRSCNRNVIMCTSFFVRFSRVKCVVLPSGVTIDTQLHMKFIFTCSRLKLQKMQINNT